MMYVNDQFYARLELEDTINPQYSMVPQGDIRVVNGEEVTFKFVIEEVYPGTVYEDTCVTGIVVDFGNVPVCHDILKECQPLYEYSWFVQKVKEYTEKLPDRDTAIEQAIRDCIRAGIFKEFVRRHGSEAVNMLFTQFNMEDAKKIWQEEAYEDGEEAGIQKGIKQGEKLNLLKLIQRKLQKGKTAEQIAEELEEPLENIIQICAAMQECGLDAEVQEIYKHIYCMEIN